LCVYSAISKPIELSPHPRVLVKGSDLGFLKKHFHDPAFKKIREHFYQQKAFATDGVSQSGFANENIRQKIEVLAYSYLLDTIAEKKSGKEAIRLAKIYLSSINNATGYHENAQAYQAVFTSALVYDWCYRLLSTADKDTLINQMLRVSCLAEYCIFKNTPKQYLNGHYGEYAPTVFLAVGLAIYDERKDVFDFAYNEQVKSFAPSRNPWYEAGTHHQGSQYIHVRYGHEILQAYLLEKAGLNPYSK